MDASVRARSYLEVVKSAAVTSAELPAAASSSAEREKWRQWLAEWERELVDDVLEMANCMGHRSKILDGTWGKAEVQEFAHRVIEEQAGGVPEDAPEFDLAAIAEATSMKIVEMVARVRH